MYGTTLGSGVAIIIFLQLIAAWLVVMLLDELVQKVGVWEAVLACLLWLGLLNKSSGKHSLRPQVCSWVRFKQR